MDRQPPTAALAGRGEAARSSVGFAQFLRGLFYVDPSRYRDRLHLAGYPVSPGHREAGHRPAGAHGCARVPMRCRAVADRGYRGDCTVLVYEFASDGTAVRVVESRLTWPAAP
jgi:hypothetical protein